MTRSESRNVGVIDSKSSPCLVGSVGTAELEGEEHEPPLSYFDFLPNENDTGKPFADYFSLQHLDDDTKQQVLQVLEEYKSVFLLDGQKLTTTDLVEFKLNLTTDEASFSLAL